MKDERALQLGRKLLPAVKLAGGISRETGVRILISASESGAVMALMTGTGCMISNFADLGKYKMERSGDGWNGHIITEDLEGQADE